MTQRVLFVQGGGPGAHSADALLAADLQERLGNGYLVDFPEVLDESNPDPGSFYPAIEAALASDPIAIVGHSIGGYVVLRYLAEKRPDIHPRVLCILAAPFPSGDENWVFDGFELPERFGEVLPRDPAVFLYASEDDAIVPFVHRALYAEAIPRARTRTTVGGHQLDADLRLVADDIRGTVEG